MVAAAIACVLSAGFSLVVARRWWASRRPAFLSWTVGFAIFSVAAGAQALGEAHGFSPALFRVFYLFGGVLGVVYLALGSAYLHLPRRAGHAAAAVLVTLTSVVAADALVVPVDARRLGSAAGVLGEALTDHRTPLYIGVVVFNIVGTLVLCGTSGWSAWRLARDRAGVDRVLCNVLLTVGALVIAWGFSTAKTVGAGLPFLGACEAVGIAVMFAGFLCLGRVRAFPRPRRLAASGPGGGPRQ